jgi:hypothetical protein
MLFILFDIEMVFLYPFAVAAGSLGIFGAVEIVLFIVTLGCTYAYVWRRAGWTGTDQESGGEAFQRDPADRCGEAVNCTWKSSRWPATFGLGAPSVATTRRTRQCAGGSEGRRWLAAVASRARKAPTAQRGRTTWTPTRMAQH